MKKWANEQIQLRGGVPVKDSVYKIDPFHIIVEDSPSWEGLTTLIIVLYVYEDSSAFACWKIETQEDKIKTKKLLDVLVTPSLMPSCKGLGMDEIIRLYYKGQKLKKTFTI